MSSGEGSLFLLSRDTLRTKHMLMMIAASSTRPPMAPPTIAPMGGFDFGLVVVVVGVPTSADPIKR